MTRHVVLPPVPSLWVLVSLFFSQPLLVSTSSLAATYDMVWNDEFNALHRTTWNVAVDSSDAGIQSYQEENVNVTNSDYGTLTASRSSNGEYTSGRIDTYQKVHFQYCTLSARIKIPNTVAGLVPTFFTQGIEYTDSTWPSNGEINIMKVGQGEAIASGNGNERVVSGLYYTGNDGTIISKSGSRDCGNDVSGNFFVYTLEWTPENVTTFYNDRPIWFMDINGIEEFHQPHYMIFNLAVGGAFPSDKCADPTAASASGGVIPDTCDNTFAAADVTALTPDYMLIDWVRIYDNGSGCQVRVVDNDGVNIVQGDSATEAPIDSETAGSIPSPVGSGWGPALTPAGLITSPSVGSPVSSPVIAPNLSPVGTGFGDGGGSPTGSGSAPGGSAPISTGGGDSPGSPTGTGSAPGGSAPISIGGDGSPGSPTGSVAAPGGPNTTPTTVHFTPAPVPAPTSVPLSPPVEPPVLPPVPAPVVAVQIPVINLPPLAPPVEPPSGFIANPPLTKCKTGKSKKGGPGVVAGDSANGKGAGKGDSVLTDGTSGGGKAEGTAGKAEGAARYRYHQRRRTQSKETKRRRELQPPAPPNATLPNATSKAAGVGVDSVGPEDCSETEADALSVDSGIMRQGTVLWAVISWMFGFSLLVV